VQEISVGLNPFAGDAIMGDVLQTFRIRYPEIGVHVEEELSNTLLRRVADGALDLAVIHFGNQSVGIPATVVAVPLAEEELVFIARRDAAPPPDGPMRFVDMAAQPLVLPKSRMGFRRDLEYAATQAHTSIRVELEINAPGPLMDMVAHGSLAAVVPESTALKAMQRLPVYFRRIVEPTVTRSILYVHRRDRPLTPALTQFVAIVGTTIEAILGRPGLDAARPLPP
jgi:DNA-binding transcriptional LysR family regulator